MWFTFVLVVVLTLLWLLLAQGDPASLLLGVPFIILAWWSYRLQVSAKPAPLSFSLTGAIRFLFFFLRESVRGGADVAARVWLPKMPLTPGFVEFRLILPEGLIRSTFLYSISLLPGTLSVFVDEHDQLQVHSLDISGDLQQELRRLEHYICAMFALPCAKETN